MFLPLGACFVGEASLIVGAYYLLRQNAEKRRMMPSLVACEKNLLCKAASPSACQTVLEADLKEAKENEEAVMLESEHLANRTAEIQGTLRLFHKPPNQPKHANSYSNEADVSSAFALLSNHASRSVLEQSFMGK